MLVEHSINSSKHQDSRNLTTNSLRCKVRSRQSENTDALCRHPMFVPHHNVASISTNHQSLSDGAAAAVCCPAVIRTSQLSA